MVVAAKGHLCIVFTQQVGDLLAVRDIVNQRIMTDADDLVGRASITHRMLNPEDIFGTNSTLGHLHIGTNLIAHEEIVPRTHSHTSLLVEQAAVGHKCALRPSGLVVTSRNHQRFVELRNDLVHQLQLGIATHITKVAGDDHKVVRK